MRPIFMRFEKTSGGDVYINVTLIMSVAVGYGGTAIDCGGGLFHFVKGTPSEVVSDIARYVAEVSR